MNPASALPSASIENEYLRPDRNLVFWPYSQIHDQRLELQDDLIVIHARPSEQAFKIGNFNRHGWIACTLGPALFVKRFSLDEWHPYHDMSCNVEAYVKDAYLELETLGPVVKLNPTESVTHKETWEVFADREYPGTLETARAICARLSSK